MGVFVGMVCACQFSSDNQWYRAVVVDLPGKQNVTIKYVDFGNTETVHFTKLKKLLDKFLILPTQVRSPITVFLSVIWFYFINIFHGFVF